MNGYFYKNRLIFIVLTCKHIPQTGAEIFFATAAHDKQLGNWWKGSRADAFFLGFS